MPITYFEHYPHYMGTMNATIKFTDKQFSKVIELAKAAIKESKVVPDGESDAAIALEEFTNAIAEKQGMQIYALEEALVDYFDSPRRPASITNALKKKGVWSGEWEEGSFAFSNKGVRAAKKAVAKIEAKLAENNFY